MTEDDKVKAGYQAAVALISYEGQLIWRAFSGMLAANSVFIGVAAAVLKLFPNQLLAAKVLAILGLLICGAWFFVQARQKSLQLALSRFKDSANRIQIQPVDADENDDNDRHNAGHHGRHQ